MKTALILPVEMQQSWLGRRDAIMFAMSAVANRSLPAPGVSPLPPPVPPMREQSADRLA